MDVTEPCPTASLLKCNSCLEFTDPSFQSNDQSANYVLIYLQNTGKLIFKIYPIKQGVFEKEV